MSKDSWYGLGRKAISFRSLNVSAYGIRKLISRSIGPCSSLSSCCGNTWTLNRNRMSRIRNPLWIRERKLFTRSRSQPTTPIYKSANLCICNFNMDCESSFSTPSILHWLLEALPFTEDELRQAGLLSEGKYISISNFYTPRAWFPAYLTLTDIWGGEIHPRLPSY